jgi:hypothetical protein
MDDTDVFVIESYKQMDAMKAAIIARYEYLEGQRPSPGQVKRLCWDVWRLTTFHIDAWNACHKDDGQPSGHAPYVPPEVAGERAERILAMDARLEEVLGDAVEADAEEDGEEEEGDAEHDFRPDAEEQVMMAEYGDIIVEYRSFVEDFNPIHLSEGDDGVVMNIIQLHLDGFDAVMRALWEWLCEHRRQAS